MRNCWSILFLGLLCWAIIYGCGLIASIGDGDNLDNKFQEHGTPSHYTIREKSQGPIEIQGHTCTLTEERWFGEDGEVLREERTIDCPDDFIPDASE